MFLPYFIAILLGWACPSDTNMNCASNSTTTVSTTGTPDGGGETPPPPAPGDDTGGELGHFPPKKP